MSNRQVRKNLLHRSMLKKSSKPGAVKLMRKYSLVDKGPLENETPQEKYAGEGVGSVQKEGPNKIEGLAPYQGLGKLSSRRKEDVEYWWKEGSQTTSQQVSQVVHTKIHQQELCTSELYKGHSRKNLDLSTCAHKKKTE